jgi:hypothetical protein
MSGDVIKVSVPCASCSEAVRFGERVCSSCGAVVSPAAKKALDHRLEAASEDFRTLESNVAAASVILVIVGAAHLILGLVMYHFATDTTLVRPGADELAAARIDLITNVSVAVAMAGCFVWARRAPTPALTTALVVWLAVQAATLSFGGIAALGLQSLRLLVMKVFAFALLVRGIGSAVRATRARKKLAPPRPQPLPRARVIGDR